MSIGGMLATALAGGAQVVGKQAGDDIDAGRKTDLMREQAAIQQQMEERLIEARARSARDQNMNLRTDNRAFDSSDDTIAASDKVAQAAGKTARGVKLAELTDTGLNDARRANTAADSKATHDQKVEETIRDSGNPSLMKAMADLENASPSKRAETNLKNAQAYQANQHGNYFKSAGAAASAKVDGKPEKMDEAAKIQYQNLFGEVKAAMAHQAKFEAEGQPLDGSNQPTQQYKLVQANVAAARRQLSAFQMRNGILDPEELAGQAIAGEKDSAKIGTAIAQAYSQGGSEFGDKFFAAVRKSGALERNAEGQASKPGQNTAGSGAKGAKTYTSGMLTGPRLGYLQGLESQGKINADEQDELSQLRATKGKEWWRGKASADDSIAK